ncbi:prepilin peptidase [Mycolicibacterium hippocampi]|uniref:prepilin peptidase n=1 Tax=Mycolicibacterium hippocampi TaxID=659824 RepID=UPI0035125A9F
MGQVLKALAVAGVAGWLVALSCFDVRQRRLPNALTLPGAATILVAASLAGHGVAAAAGAAGMFAVYAVVHLVAPQAMGAGDVKLSIGLGALTGAFGVYVWLVAALGASVLTVLLGLAALVRGNRSPLPHGPSMCVAAGAAVTLALL